MQGLSHRRMPPVRVAELVAAYLDADYRWELDGQWHPMVIGEPAPRVERAFPDARHFGMLSAWNPQSIERPEPANRADDDLLHKMLAASELPFRAAFASARNRSWREPGWIVMDMPLPAFDALGRRFNQLGTLYWDRGQPVRLRMYVARPDVVPLHPAIDWLE